MLIQTYINPNAQIIYTILSELGHYLIKLKIKKKVFQEFNFFLSYIINRAVNEDKKW